MMVGMALNRRGFLRNALVAPAAAQLWWSQAAKEAQRRLLFVGTRTDATSKGIYAYKWDPIKGNLTSLGLAAAAQDPTFLALHPDGEHVYAANELLQFESQASGAVTAFSIDRASSRLKRIDQIASEGAGTCHVALSHSGRSVFCANYNGGSATSFYANPTGAISDPVSHIQFKGHGPNQERQEGPHAHRVTPSPDDNFLLVNDLGGDCIHIFHLNDSSARLTPSDPPQFTAAPGSGPRALRFHPNGRIVYCVYELASKVQVLHWDKQKGTLHPIQELSLIPPNYHGPTSTGCDIVLDRKARFAYAINRGYDCVVTFAVDHDGQLRTLHSAPCGGKTPRHLALDPTEGWLLIANQTSDNLSIFKRNQETGALDDTPRNYPISIPQCLLFA
jgi:6-phosphogluconolactonase